MSDLMAAKARRAVPASLRPTLPLLAAWMSMAARCSFLMEAFACSAHRSSALRTMWLLMLSQGVGALGGRGKCMGFVGLEEQ